MHRKWWAKVDQSRDFQYILEISWIKRLLTTAGNWQLLFEAQVYKQKKLVWELDPKSLKRIIFGIKNLFWKNVLESWMYYKAAMPNTDDPRSLPIEVLVSDKNPNLQKVVLKLQSHDILYINDLIMENGGYCGYEDFKHKYQLDINFLDFY